MKEGQELKEEQVKSKVANFYPPPVGKVVTHWVIKVYSANHEPERWRRHRQAADRSYASWGLEAVGRDHKEGCRPRFPVESHHSMILMSPGTGEETNTYG